MLIKNTHPGKNSVVQGKKEIPINRVSATREVSKASQRGINPVRT